MTDDVIASIADNCPAISVLNIGGVRSITDTSMKCLAKLEHLTSLNISHSETHKASSKSQILLVTYTVYLIIIMTCFKSLA
uniref:Uncharacterized protein n=1 Tax=Timema bartmani TaxID=61472 RepID=A0A7R9EZ22_9NEOP|nr:unnamed protein product [Timema bartmani]